MSFRQLAAYSAVVAVLSGVIGALVALTLSNHDLVSGSASLSGDAVPKSGIEDAGSEDTRRLWMAVSALGVEIDDLRAVLLRGDVSVVSPERTPTAEEPSQSQYEESLEKAVAELLVESKTEPSDEELSALMLGLPDLVLSPVCRSGVCKAISRLSITEVSLAPSAIALQLREGRYQVSSLPTGETTIYFFTPEAGLRVFGRQQRYR